MLTRLEELPNELFLYMFCTYFDGVQLYKSFFGINSRFNSLLKSLKNIYLRLEYSEDDESIKFFSTQVVSLYIGSRHNSQRFVPFLIHVRSITLVDPTMIQIMNLLEIGNNLEHVSILWSNPYLMNIISVRSFYELIFSSSSSENLRSCRLCLPQSHSLYLEPKQCSLPLLHSAHIQISLPIADFRRIIRLCPNLIRLEIEIIENNDNEELTLILNHFEHINIRRFHISNLISLDIFDIYIGYLPYIENVYISMKFSSDLMDIFEQFSSLINRIDYLKEFYFYFSTNILKLGENELEIIQKLNPFFSNINIRNEDNQIIFTTQ